MTISYGGKLTQLEGKIQKPRVCPNINILIGPRGLVLRLRGAKEATLKSDERSLFIPKKPDGV